MNLPARAKQIEVERYRRSFVWGVEILIALLGVVALVGPETAEPVIARTFGILLMLTGFLALLVGLIDPPSAARRRLILAWALLALVIGPVVQWFPARGLLSLGAATGLLLVGHGLMATTVAVRQWRTSGLKGMGVGLAAIFALLVGLALLLGKDAGDRIDEMIIGVDVVLFGAYLIAGRLLLENPDRKINPEAERRGPSGM